MRHHRAGLWLVTLLLGSSTAWAETPRPKLAVLDARLTNIDAQFAPLLTEVVTSEAHDVGRYDVVSGRDIVAMLDFENQRQLVDCTEVSCLAEMGGALGVDYILVPDIGMLGKSYIVNIKLIDIRTPKVEGRVYDTVQGELDVLIATIKRAVTRVLAGDGAPAPTSTTPKGAPEATTTPAATAPPMTAEAQGPATTSRVPLWPTVLLGTSAVATGLGIYFGIRARDHYNNARDVTFVGRQAEIAPGKSAQLYADVAFGVALASAGTGLWLWLRPSPSSPPIAIVPLEHGVALGATFPFSLAQVTP